MPIDIRQAFKDRGFDLNEDQVQKFILYKNLLQEWNQNLNLVADSSDTEIVFRHFIDSLAITNYATIEPNSKVIDVGTGAGFPGIPLAIYTNCQIFLVDSLKKRLDFLNIVITQLNLNNVQCVHSRFEDLAHNSVFRENFDYAICRAVAPLNVLLEYTLPFLSNNGLLLAHKGSMLEDEIALSKKALTIFNGDIVDKHEYLDDKLITRYVIVIKKTHTISKKYPRKPGTPKSSPIT